MADRPVLVLIAGMGKTNAARALTATLEHESVAGIVGFGVAGAYPRSRLEIGSVALADIAHYGDEGVETPDGWISCEGIGIPLFESADQRHFNDFPCDEACVEAVKAAFSALGRPISVGGFVTVSTCSGTAERGRRLARRYDALCETMEGAAYAHTARHYGVPYLELRGISNLVMDRDLRQWRLEAAAIAVAEALPIVVGAWPYPRVPNDGREAAG